MKKALFSFFVCLTSFNVFSQNIFTTYTSEDIELEEQLIPRNRSLYASISSGMSATRDFAISAEFGTWGLKKPTSYSITFDAVKNVDEATTFNYWLGLKPYYTFYEKDKLSIMLYFAPKVKINNDFDFLIENGLSMNCTLSDQLIFSTGLAFQSGKNYTMTPSISLGLAVLLQKPLHNTLHHRKTSTHKKNL